MEKLERISNMDSIEGDNDDSVDWEDFVIVSGTHSFIFNFFF